MKLIRPLIYIYTVYETKIIYYRLLAYNTDDYDYAMKFIKSDHPNVRIDSDGYDMCSPSVEILSKAIEIKL